MPQATVYWFKIKTLPRDVYGVIKRMKVDYDLTNWQAVILGITALVHVAKTDAIRFKGMVEQTKANFPDKHLKSLADPE